LSALLLGDDIEDMWYGTETVVGMTVDQRRAVIVGLVEVITVDRGAPGRPRKVDTTLDGVTVHWKALPGNS